MCLTITDMVMDWEFFSIAVFLIIGAFSIIFLSYWTFRLFNLPKVAATVSIILFASGCLLVASPWISDWLFTGNDAKKVLSKHGYSFTDEVELISNESAVFDV